MIKTGFTVQCILYLFTEELTFDNFVDICKKEPVTSADDLMKAFKKIDINGDNYISLDELHKILTSVSSSSYIVKLSEQRML
jgi:Ca2+-binding EF-hand superfamily protein